MSLSLAAIKKRFKEIVNAIDPATAGNNPKDFSRNRLCSLPDVLMILITMAGHSTNAEINNYFKTLNRPPEKRPSASALSQQRSKLRDTVLPDLFSETNKQFPFNKTRYGMHFLAADGSDVNAPALKGDLSTFVTNKTGEEGYHQMHLDALYDLLENRYVDACITPKAEYNENAALCRMVDRNPLDGPCLYIADRAYPTFNTLAHIQEAGHFFLIRAKDPESCCSPLKGIIFPDAETAEIDHSFIIRRRRVGKNEDPAVYKNMRNDRVFDYIEIEDRTSEYKISFRIVKIKLAEDKYEYLVTNLPPDKYSPKIYKALYHMRWGIETSFRHLKYKVGLNFFHSKKRQFIYQEIFARLIMYNLISLCIRNTPVPKPKRGAPKWKKQISFSDGADNCREFLITKMRGTTLKSLLQKHLEPIRPNRSAFRKVRSQRVQAFSNRP